MYEQQSREMHNELMTMRQELERAKGMIERSGAENGRLMNYLEEQQCEQQRKEEELQRVTE